jgi:hypothetical protein
MPVDTNEVVKSAVAALDEWLEKAEQMSLFGKQHTAEPPIMGPAESKKLKGELEAMKQKHVPAAAAAVAGKAPQGYQPIPHSKHGGYRKREGAGYVYWYPGAGISKRPKTGDHPDDEKMRYAHQSLAADHDWAERNHVRRGNAESARAHRLAAAKLRATADAGHRSSAGEKARAHSQDVFDEHPITRKPEESKKPAEEPKKPAAWTPGQPVPQRPTTKGPEDEALRKFHGQMADEHGKIAEIHEKIAKLRHLPEAAEHERAAEEHRDAEAYNRYSANADYSSITSAASNGRTQHSNATTEALKEKHALKTLPKTFIDENHPSRDAHANEHYIHHREMAQHHANKAAHKLLSGLDDEAKKHEAASDAHAAAASEFMWSENRDALTSFSRDKLRNIAHEAAKKAHAKTDAAYDPASKADDEAPDLVKAGKHATAPEGFEPVKGSRHGGHAKHGPTGLEYWYPGSGPQDGPHDGDRQAHHEAMARHHRELAIHHQWSGGDSKKSVDVTSADDKQGKGGGTPHDLAAKTHAAAANLHDWAAAAHSANPPKGFSPKEVVDRAERYSELAHKASEVANAHGEHKPKGDKQEKKDMDTAKKSIRFNGLTIDASEDETIAKALESGELQFGITGRHYSPRKLQKGTIYEGEDATPIDMVEPSEAVRRAQVAAETREYDPDKTGGNGGLPEWWQDGIVQVVRPNQTIVIDNSDPLVRAAARKRDM